MKVRKYVRLLGFHRMMVEKGPSMVELLTCGKPWGVSVYSDYRALNSLWQILPFFSKFVILAPFFFRICQIRVEIKDSFHTQCLFLSGKGPWRSCDTCSRSRSPARRQKRCCCPRVTRTSAAGVSRGTRSPATSRTTAPRCETVQRRL